MNGDQNVMVTMGSLLVWVEAGEAGSGMVWCGEVGQVW